MYTKNLRTHSHILKIGLSISKNRNTERSSSDEGSCYYFSLSEPFLTWDEAELACIQNKSNLASILSQYEQDEMTGRIDAEGSKHDVGVIHIGLVNTGKYIHTLIQIYEYIKQYEEGELYNTANQTFF